MKTKLRSLFFKIWYWYVSTIDKNAEVIFMNFGYSKNKNKIKLDDDDEKNRYSAQLYNLVSEGVVDENKSVLEVGCGRGGGLSFVNRYFSPISVTGIDLNKKAIQFCNNFYSKGNSNFIQANAQELPFEDNSFDVVLNVESSHRYLQMNLFLNEVNRVLKPGGFFSFTDFREAKDIEILHKQLLDAGFKIEKEEDITANVVEALELATPSRERLVKKLAPKFLHGLAKNFAATKGTETYNRFKNRYYVYVFYILRKQN